MNVSPVRTNVAAVAIALALAAPAAANPTASFSWATHAATPAGDGIRTPGAERWLVTVDGCRSRSDGPAIVRFRWTVSRDAERLGSMTTTLCRPARPAPPIPPTCLRPGSQDDPECEPVPVEPTTRGFFLPEGRYRIRLQVTDREGRTDATSRSVTVENKLIVALGDSFTSGEGNPDRQGATGIDGYSGVRWLNRQCHRSAKPAVARVAAEIERSDPHTSVSFHNYGCSGAEIDSGLLGRYDGIEGGDDLPAQVDQLRALMCRGRRTAACTRTMEPIDHLLLTVGINDINFSKILETCMRYGDHCRPIAGPYFDEGYRGLLDGYRRLAIALGRFPIRRISIVEYPTDPFEKRTVVPGAPPVAGGCGVMDGISPAEAEWLAQLGLRLRARMRDAARRYGWAFVGGTTDAFRGHGYCSDDEWYRGFQESLDIQGDKYGTMHPDADGHRATTRLLLASMRASGPTPRPPGNSNMSNGPQDVDRS